LPEINGIIPKALAIVFIEAFALSDKKNIAPVIGSIRLQPTLTGHSQLQF